MRASASSLSALSAMLAAVAFSGACRSNGSAPPRAAPFGPGEATSTSRRTMNVQHEAGNPFDAARAEMVRAQIERRGVSDERVLRAMHEVPRHRFVPPDLADRAYDDRPLPIGHGQTISQPYVVAFMSEALQLRGSERVLEIGTGSGYQAAILGKLAARVHTIEIVEALGRRATEILRAVGAANVSTRVGDGYKGWPEVAPFDAILLTAAPEKVPAPLLAQLAPGGRLVAPVGPAGEQVVIRIVRDGDGGLRETRLLPVRFVPMTGEAQRDSLDGG